MGALKLTTTQFDKFKHNVIIFIIPLALLYLGQIGVTFTQPANVIDLGDFLPNSLTVGGMIQYLISVLIDYKKKFDASNG